MGFVPTDDSGRASYDIHSIIINLRINPGRNKDTFPLNYIILKAG